MEQKVIDYVVKSLKFNGRESFENIAGACSIEFGTEIDVDDVENIIKSLFQESKIFGFSCAIDPRAFDIYPVMVWVKGEEDYNVIRQQLSERCPDWGNITDVLSLFGEYDFQVRMYTNSIGEANTDINNIISAVEVFPSTTTIQTEIYRREGFTLKSATNPTFRHKTNATDKKILEILQRNCHNTDQQIASQINLKGEEVTRRIARMEREAIILGYGLQIDYVEWNMPEGIVEILLNGKSSYTHVVEQLLQLPKENVVDIYSALGGEGHIVVGCCHETIKDLSILIDKMNKIPGVRRTKSHIIAEHVHKDIAVRL